VAQRAAAALQLAAQRIQAGGQDGSHDEEAAEGAGQQPETLVGQRPQQRAEGRHQQAMGQRGQGVCQRSRQPRASQPSGRSGGMARAEAARFAQRLITESMRHGGCSVRATGRCRA
jgi:hypothetical protein